MTVREMLERIDSVELSEWYAFDQLEPLGDKRADFRAGVIAATVANFLQSRKKPKTYHPKDFMFFLGDEPEAGGEAWEKQLAVVERLNAAFGGKDLRPKP